MSRVLIVEDEAHIADGLQFNLEAEGHSAQIAADGETALDLLLRRGERFDAMVLDVMLPGKGGFEVASDLRQAKNFIPILMLTARGRPEDVLKGFASGADDHWKEQTNPRMGRGKSSGSSLLTAERSISEILSFGRKVPLHI